MGNLYIDSKDKFNVELICKGNVLLLQIPEELKGLRAHITLVVNGETIPYHQNGMTFQAEKTEDLRITIKVSDKIIANGIIFSHSDAVHIEPQTQNEKMTTHELRAISQWGKLPEKKHNFNPEESYRIRTDLHTHFPGAIRAEELYNVATENGTGSYYYPTALLQTIGIAVEEYTAVDSKVVKENARQSDYDNDMAKFEVKTYIDLKSLTIADKNKFINSLAIGHSSQIIFDHMEDYYDLRDPLTKDIKLFEKFLRSLAKDYNKYDVQAVSLSFGKCTDLRWLRIIERVCADIYKQDKIRIRFLASIPRTLNHELRMQRIAQLQSVATHPDIEGVDYLASETNSTFEFYDDLHIIAQWACVHDKDFVIRVHAGENTYHPENVRAVLAIADQYGIKVRVGHGIYGLDEATLALAKKLSDKNLLIIEMNPDSNFTLNSVDNIKDYPLVRYAKAGVAVALGSDGHGLYQTDPEQTIHYLQYLDCEPAVIEASLNLGEKTYLLQNEQGFTRKQRSHQEKMARRLYKAKHENPKITEDAAKDIAFQEVYAPPRFTKSPAEIQAKYTQHANDKAKVLADQFKANGTSTDADQIKVATAGKLPIMITGALLANSKPEDYQRTQAIIDTIIATIDPSNAYIVTTGNNYGIQKQVHEAVAKHNVENPNNYITLMGYVAKSAHHSDIATQLDFATTGYNKWYDLHRYIAKNIQGETANNLQMVVVGGTMLTRDTVQAAYNTITQGDSAKDNKNLYLVRGVEGASGDKAAHLPPQFSVEFNNVIPQLVKNNPQAFKAGLSQEGIAQIYESSKEAATNKVTEIISRQGPYEKVNAKDKARWLISTCKRLGFSDENDRIMIKDQLIDFDHVVRYFSNNCPVDDPIHTLILEQRNKFSLEFLDILGINIPLLSQADALPEAFDLISQKAINQLGVPEAISLENPHRIFSQSSLQRRQEDSLVPIVQPPEESLEVVTAKRLIDLADRLDKFTDYLDEYSEVGSPQIPRQTTEELRSIADKLATGSVMVSNLDK
jgi:hypothetical protein